MGRIQISFDPKPTESGFLGAVDLQLCAAIADCFYVLCLAKEYGHERASIEYRKEYGAETLSIQYSSPFHWIILLRNVSKKRTRETLAAIADRTLFYRPEYRKRMANAKIAEQKAIERTISNLERLPRLKKKLLKAGVKTETVEKAIAKALEEQGAQLTYVED